MKFFLSLAALYAVKAQPSHDTLFISFRSEAGVLGAYDASGCLQVISDGCVKSPFVSIDYEGGKVYAATASNIHAFAYPRDTSTAASNCGTPLLTADASRRIAVARVSNKTLYYSDVRSGAGNGLYTATLPSTSTSAATPVLFLADGADGVNGMRESMSLSGSAVYYGYRGVDATGAAKTGVSVASLKANTSIAAFDSAVFTYGSTQRSYPVDMDTNGTSANPQLWWSEFRADSNSTAMQLSSAAGQSCCTYLGGMQGASSSNTGSLAVDKLAREVSDGVVWATSDADSIIGAFNAQKRGSVPQYYAWLDLAAVTKTYGFVSDLTFVNGPSSGCAIPYISHPSVSSSPALPLTCSPSSSYPCGALVPSATNNNNNGGQGGGNNNNGGQGGGNNNNGGQGGGGQAATLPQMLCGGSSVVPPLSPTPIRCFARNATTGALTLSDLGFICAALTKRCSSEEVTIPKTPSAWAFPWTRL